ncbi:hypothetical protein [Zavarzinella formosa]|uniref:hypothetical protein n=1 Tax=Zavarzinella formosa TaxID=360055 RepID=UPI0002E811A9|nr:hypothetical protein [Zavarzinella formosa]
MLEHRFREYFRSSSVTIAAPVACAFVPCPMFQMFGMAQQSRIQEIYRLAAEQTREQLKVRPQTRKAEFSIN